MFKKILKEILCFVKIIIKFVKKLKDMTEKCSSVPVPGGYTGATSDITYDGQQTCTGFSGGTLNDYIEHITEKICEMDIELSNHTHDADVITIINVTDPDCFDKGTTLTEHINNLQERLCSLVDVVEEPDTGLEDRTEKVEEDLATQTLRIDLLEGATFTEFPFPGMVYPPGDPTPTPAPIPSPGSTEIDIPATDYWISGVNYDMGASSLIIPDSSDNYIFIDPATSDYDFESVAIGAPSPATDGEIIMIVTTGVGTIASTTIVMGSSIINEDLIDEGVINATHINEAEMYNDSIALTGGVFGVNPINSIENDAATDRIQLVNDENAPGNSKYYGTNGAGLKGYHALPTYDFANAESISYAALVALRDANELDAGRFYLISDYATVYEQPDFNIDGSPKVSLETKTAVIGENLLVLATSGNTIANQARSLEYPNDYIEYELDYTTLVNGDATYGRITKRIDDNGNEAPYDFRTILFKRYEETDGGGDYFSYTDTGFGYEEYLTFGTGSKNNKIGKFDVSLLYDDYYLGSLNEMIQLQSILASSSALRTEYGFDDDLYWTSTEVDGDTAKVIDMETGDDYNAPKDLVATSYDELFTIPIVDGSQVISLTTTQDFVLITKEWADYVGSAMDWIIDCGAETDYVGLSKEFGHFDTGSIMDLDGLTIEGITFAITENTPGSDYTITIANGTRTHTITLTNFEGLLGNIYTPKTRAIRDFRSTIDYSDKDELQGGVIFYKDTDHYGAGDHRYFVAYTEDSATLHTWGTMATVTGGTGTVIGTGETNTATILAADPTAEAPLYCDELEVELANPIDLPNNVFNDTTINNIFPDNTYNITALVNSGYYADEGMINNRFDYPITNTDLSGATHLYNEYNCEIYYDRTDGLQLRYMDIGILEVADVTD